MNGILKRIISEFLNLSSISRNGEETKNVNNYSAQHSLFKLNMPDI